MADLDFQKRMTRSAFEVKLTYDFGADKLSKTIHKENGWDDDRGCPKIITVTLYYIKDVHIASWCKGDGWIFSKVYDGSIAKEQAELDKFFEAHPNA